MAVVMGMIGVRSKPLSMDLLSHLRVHDHRPPPKRPATSSTQEHVLVERPCVENGPRHHRAGRVERATTDPIPMPHRLYVVRIVNLARPREQLRDHTCTKPRVRGVLRLVAGVRRWATVHLQQRLPVGTRMGFSRRLLLSNAIAWDPLQGLPGASPRDLAFAGAIINCPSSCCAQTDRAARASWFFDSSAATLLRLAEQDGRTSRGG